MRVSRLYCQLVVQTHRTNVTGYGSLPSERTVLSPEPTLADCAPNTLNSLQNGLVLYPTPTTQEAPRKVVRLTERGRRKAKNGKQAHSLNLADLAKLGMLPQPYMMLPTPRNSEYKGTGPIGSKSYAHMLEKDYLCAVVQHETGQSGPLNPLFVSEMMGFPPDWILSAFLK